MITVTITVTITIITITETITVTITISSATTVMTKKTTTFEYDIPGKRARTVSATTRTTVNKDG